MNNKGTSEIISQILLMLITVVVIGIILTALIPQITTSKSQLKFEESKRLRDNLYNNIQEVYNSPIGYTKEIELSLENLTLIIDSNTNTIEVYSIINGDFYKDNLRLDDTSEKYTYRNGQKLYAGFTLSNIDLVRSYILENQLNATIYLRKTDKDKITILLENVIEDDWFTASNLGLYDETPSTWQYRKKILIDGNKVDGNLTNFPALIYLEDQDLKNYANSDGNDIIFTSKDGKTKLKREIESYSLRENYEYRKKITIDKDKVDGDLTDFPMLVSLLDSDLKTYAQSDGRDIYFTSSDGTRLKREIEDYNSTTGSLVAWVKIPSLSSIENTDIYMYFGNSEENNTNDTNVWDSNYVGVWHSNDYNSTTIADSTLNNNIGTKVSANNPIETTGKIGKAQAYLGDDYITILTSSIQTASLWTNLNSVTDIQYFLGGSGTGIRYNGTNFLVYNGSAGYVTLNWTKENAWKYLTITKVNSNDYNFYIDGNLLGVATAGTNGTNIGITFFGKRNDGYYYNGPIDEVRISNITRSESWIKTEYNNQSAPENFYSIGELETILTPHSEVFAWVKIPELTTEEDTAIYMYFGNETANESNDKDVWDDGFIMVQHLNESPNNDENGFIDSTKNNFTGIAKGFDNINSTTSTDGQIGGANKHKIILDGGYPSLASSNYVEFGTIYNNDWNYQTISVWVNFTGETNGGYALIFGDERYNNFGRFVLNGPGSILIQNQPTSNLFSSNRVPTNEFAHIVYRYNIDENKEYIFVNGQKEEKNRDVNIKLNTSPLRLGYADSFAFSGIIDEFKVSDVARSDSWIKTEFNNQSIPEAFIKVGVLEKS
ncbi:MAG TPA: DUF2341 domain-containing protein [archaeon]|nr:DUF2341 domain-containing protein [archaeon]